MRIAFSLAALLATTSSVFGASGDLRIHDTERRAPLENMTALDIRNVSGSIALTQATTSTVIVHARATSPDSDPSLARLDVHAEGDKLVVCVRYPGTGCDADRHRSDGGGDLHQNDITVDLHIAVPRGIHIAASTVQGSVIAGKLDDNLSASVVSGSITVASRGSVQAQTVDGPIEATVALGAGETGNFQTVNGPIHIIFPRGASAAVSAKTLSGIVLGDGVRFEHGEEGFVGHDATAKLGNGDANVSIQTVSGPIRVSEL